MPSCARGVNSSRAREDADFNSEICLSSFKESCGFKKHIEVHRVVTTPEQGGV
jgi:hypothetical protein